VDGHAGHDWKEKAMFLSKMNVRRMTVVAMTLVALTTMGGCYDYGLLGGLGGTGSLLGGWGGTGGWGGYGYDPTNLISGVVNDRLTTMDNAANAWDQYITGDYLGGDNDDPSTPTYWASGYEW
jgi:hypothetical protein